MSCSLYNANDRKIKKVVNSTIQRGCEQKKAQRKKLVNAFGQNENN